jgi:hypothetical protein
MSEVLEVCSVSARCSCCTTKFVSQQAGKRTVIIHDSCSLFPDSCTLLPKP